MKVTVAVLTYCRPWLLERTLTSLLDTPEMYNLIIMDNGNGVDAVTNKLLEQAPATVVVQRDNLPVGKAMNELMDIALSYRPDLVVFSADDYEYKHWWLDDLVAWWEDAPDDIGITSCHMEDEYPWNTVTEAVTYGGRRGLVRKTLPGSSWTFRSPMWSAIGPLQETTGGEDLGACNKLRSEGYRLCALDLAEHIGEKQSAWGNQSYRISWPIDKGKWGL